MKFNSWFRFVTKSSVSGEINRIAFKENWEMVQILPDGENVPYQKSFRTRDKKAVYHYIEDPLISLNYIMVEAKDNDLRDEATALFKTRFNKMRVSYFSEEEVRALFGQLHSASNTSELEKCVHVVGVASPQECEPTFLTFSKELSSTLSRRCATPLS